MSEEGTVSKGHSSSETLVRLEGLTKHFDTQSGFLGGLGLRRDGVIPRPTFDHEWVRATDGVSFEIKKGETLGLVGESGCGKSTLARTVIKLLEPTDGAIHFKDDDLADMSGEELRRMRQEMQIIFQDPQSSLDPRMKVGKIVEEPMAAHGLPKSDPAVETTAQLTIDGGGITHDSVSVSVADDVDLVIDPDPDGVVRVPITIHPKDNTEDLVRRDNNGDGVEIEIQLPDGLIAEREVDSTADGTRINLSVRVGESKKELRKRRVRELLDRVGLDPQHYNRYPHQFSGGQRQRINLARALSVDPEFIVCDEPTSALDASIQAQVLNTMIELQEEFDLTYLFISHDLSVIRHIADRVAVMYLGEIVELAETEALFENPQHPYTEALLSAIPVPDPRASETRALLEGDVPSPIDPPSGCRFRTRCPKLIAPEEYDLAEQEWTQIKVFMRAVERRTFDLEELLRDRFFTITLTGDVAGIVERAIDAVCDGNYGEATQLLDESFRPRSPEFNPSGEYDLTDQEWAGITAFMQAVGRESFDLEELLRERFFEGYELSGDAAAIVDRAIEHVLADNWEEAAHLLDESFARKSICAREVPRYEIDSDDGTTKRVANCHLRRDE